MTQASIPPNKRKPPIGVLGPWTKSLDHHYQDTKRANKHERPTKHDPHAGLCNRLAHVKDHIKGYQQNRSLPERHTYSVRKRDRYFLRGFLARSFLVRSFGAARGALLTTLLPVPIAPAGAACSIAAWM